MSDGFTVAVERKDGFIKICDVWNDQTVRNMRWINAQSIVSDSQEPEQEHNRIACTKFAKEVGAAEHKIGFEAGKASLKPLEISDESFRVFWNAYNETPLPIDHESMTPYEIGAVAFKNGLKALTAHFAAPERKYITAERIYEVLFDELRTSPDICKRVTDKINSLQPAPERKSYGPNPGLLGKWIRDFGFEWAELALHLSVKTQELLDDLYPMQPAPEEAEPRCSVCDHKDGIYRDPEDGDITLYCGWRKCNCTDRFHRERGTV